jgi:TonB family protein
VPLDPKAVEAEVQKQLAAKRKEMEKAAAASAGAKKPSAVPAQPETMEVAAAEPPAAAPAEPPPLPTAAPPPRPEPTTAPTEPPPPTEVPRLALAAREPETQRGDLVGPGAGVIEPALIASPRVVYPPIAREQRVTGRVVALVLVDENGRVAQSKLQQGLEGQAAVNEAVMAAVRNAKFRSATKNGIPVKMWRPVIVDVKP